MNTKEQPEPRIMSTELGSLWTAYMNDSMAICVLKHFLVHAKDRDVTRILKFALELSEKHVAAIAGIFQKENQPIPQGFTDHDVDLDAPRLFSDIFALVYLQNMSRFGLLAYGTALPLAARKDVNDYFHKCLASSSELSKKITAVMLQKGFYSRPPYIPPSQNVEFVDQQSYMHGWFGKQRPLSSIEVNDVFMCQLTNIFSKVLLMGYAQVAKQPEVRKYFQTGMKIAAKHIEVFTDLLKRDSLPSPQTWDSEITESTISPFSDKLMMFHSRVLSTGGIANYGGAMSTSMRHDLQPMYARLAAELGKYGDKGAELMIENKWLEQPPLAANRDQLIRQGSPYPSAKK